MNEKELQRLNQQAARVGMDAGTTVEAFRRLTEAFRRFPEMPMPTRELANNSSEVDRDNDELISRREATQTALDFIVEYLGGAFDEDFQKKLMERMNALPSAQPERIQNNAVHLCDSCQYTYVTCPSYGNDAVFGGGKGNDNICACNKYRPISAQPEPHWIPCSERLPDVAQRVLLSGHEQVMVGMLHSFGKYSLEPTGISYIYPKDDIEAWMPLPEPYKKEGEAE